MLGGGIGLRVKASIVFKIDKYKMSLQDSILNYKTTLKGTDSDKLSSLQHLGINYDRKEVLWYWL